MKSTALELMVMAQTQAEELRLVAELRAAVPARMDVQVRPASQSDARGQLVFVDARIPGLARVLETLDRRRRAVFLIVEETQAAPQALLDGKVDDVLVRPFRPLEVLGKLSHYHQVLAWDEVSELNDSFKSLLGRLQEDLQLVERLQKGRLPTRFPDLKGFKIGSRYLAGMRSGGDHFDLAETQGADAFSMVLSDSSSYGLSSAVLSVLMRVAVKLSVGESRSCAETVGRIREELASVLGEKDRLSLFYGTVFRKDYRFRYLNLGSACAYYAPPKGIFRVLGSQGEAIRHGAPAGVAAEAEIVLEPGSRLALVSDGFVDAAGGPKALEELLSHKRGEDSAGVLNELVYRVKSRFEEDDDMPEQDCTAAVFDLDPRAIRLTG